MAAIVQCMLRLLHQFVRLTRPAVTEVRRQGITWRLHTDSCVDRSIVIYGSFERKTTRLVKRFVKPGMHILDVGANFGYFTTLFAKLVGPEGKVWAFEPTKHFGCRIEEHLKLNGLTGRAVVLDYGLSDKEAESFITIGESSATLHSVSPQRNQPGETIKLKRLDDVYEGLQIERVDLLKVDIDGHEPSFIAGAKQFLQKYAPVILIEFSQSNLDVADSDVRELYEQLQELGYTLCSEETQKPFSSRRQFLLECGNFTHSANVWAVPSGVISDCELFSCS